MLFRAGDQVPVIPLLDVIGNAANATPEQIAGTCVKLGVIIWFTVIDIVAVVAHCPESGVKV